MEQQKRIEEEGRGKEAMREIEKEERGGEEKVGGREREMEGGR